MDKKKEPLREKIEYLLITTQNNAIRTNSVKAKIEKAQQNSTCKLCGNVDEMFNHLVREYY